MKVSRQKLAAREYLLSSKFCSTSTGGNNRTVQRQLEQLAAQLPVVAVWLVYQDPTVGKRQSVTYYKSQLENFSSEFSYWESEQWWVDSLPAMQVCQLPTVEKYKAFVCLFGQYDSEPEYLLLCTEVLISPAQEQWIEQQAQLLTSYLDIWRQCYRQQMEIQLLEQALRRTEHQLRNPLALIGLYAANLCHSLPTGALQEQATVIQETVHELSSSLADLISCGQQAKLRLSPHDLREICLESIKGLQPWIEDKKLQINLPEKPLNLLVDRCQIKQVFDNLLSNAVHFSPQYGIINCHWEAFYQEVLVEISDQGPGLSEEDILQAFTPFYSKRPGGTGLGLAIAKKVILDHQGSLWVQNLSAGGAQFSFTLPRKRS